MIADTDLILNTAMREPDDEGWYQIAPYGEFPAVVGGRKFTQVIDREAAQALAESFIPNSTAALIDFDHFSMDPDRSSEAAGWTQQMEARDDGLYARIDWSDVGAGAVKGKRFRFFSPVWNRADCETLAGGRIRPRRLKSLALTNAPNIPHRPITNRNPNEEVTMTAIAEALGLPADADEATVLEALKALQSRVDELETADSETKADEIMNRFADVIQDKDAIRKQIIANREGTLAVLQGLRAASKADTLPNRRDGKLPTLDGEKAADEAQAAAIRNRAGEIRKTEGLTFSAAWDRASTEIRNRK